MVKEVSGLAEFNSIIEKNNVVVVDFYATWCGPCKFIAPAFEKMASQYKQATFLKCDVDRNQDVSQAQGVRAMPTFIVFKSGKKDATVMGADARKLEAAIRSAAGPPSQDSSSSHSWGSGNTLGSSTTPSSTVTKNPTETARSVLNGFSDLDNGMKTIVVLITLYVLYIVFG